MGGGGRAAGGEVQWVVGGRRKRAIGRAIGRRAPRGVAYKQLAMMGGEAPGKECRHRQRGRSQCGAETETRVREKAYVSLGSAAPLSPEVATHEAKSASWKT